MSPEIICVGAGHNNLVTAAYLSAAGKRVLVLDRNTNPGGGVVTEELNAPGFRHDLHSALHIVIQANPLLRNDELGLIRDFGLNYIYPDAIYSSIDDEGRAVVTFHDLDQTCESFARISPRDAKAYREFVALAMKSLPMMVHGMFVPPVPMGGLVGILDQSPDGRQILEIMHKSCWDIAHEWFEHPRIILHLLKLAHTNLAGPEEKGTGLTLLMMAGFPHLYRSGMPVGGSGGLTDALVRCIEHHGGEVRTGQNVRQVMVEAGRTTGVILESGERIAAGDAVVAAIHPHLLGDVVDGLAPELVTRARKVQPALVCSILCNYALREPPQFRTSDPDGPRAGFIELVPGDLNLWRREFDRIRYGETHKLGESVVKAGGSMSATVHTNHDPSRAPPGCATLYNIMYVPYELASGGAAQWDLIKEQVADDMLGDLRSFIGNIGPENVLGRSAHSPLDMERWSPSYQAGDAHGCAPYLYQFGGMRPIPELAQYAVPGAERLYLCGPFMHPGGGVIGGGRATAIRVFNDLGLDFDKLAG